MLMLTLTPDMETNSRKHEIITQYLHGCLLEDSSLRLLTVKDCRRFGEMQYRNLNVQNDKLLCQMCFNLRILLQEN
jgi:hypothetical protein